MTWQQGEDAFSLEGATSRHGSATLPVECDRAESIATADATSRRREVRLFDGRVVGSRECQIGQERRHAGCILKTKRKHFFRGIMCWISKTEREKTRQQPPASFGSKLVYGNRGFCFAFGFAVRCPVSGPARAFPNRVVLRHTFGTQPRQRVRYICSNRSIHASTL